MRSVPSPSRARVDVAGRLALAALVSYVRATAVVAVVDAVAIGIGLAVILLLSDGYPSIGCEPCTRRVAPGEDPRAGRWAGLAKTECGLHVTDTHPEEAR